MATKKQLWAIKRNWLIMRLLGAKSIFTWTNICFMEESIGREKVREEHLVANCEVALDHLLCALRKTKSKE